MLSNNTMVHLLMGPDAGEIVVCGIFQDREEALAKARKHNASEREEFGRTDDPWRVESWRVQ